MPGRPIFRTARSIRTQISRTAIASRSRTIGDNTLSMTPAAARSPYVKPMPVCPLACASTMTIVVESHSIVASASGKSVGIVYADTSNCVILSMAYYPLNQLSNSIFCNRRHDLGAVRFAPQQRLRELLCLAYGYFRWHRRLVRIDDRFHEHRSRCVQDLLDHAPAVVRIIHRQASSTARLREQREIDGLQVACIFGITEKHHLLPLDLSQGVVLDDEDFYRQLVLHARGELRHQH